MITVTNSQGITKQISQEEQSMIRQQGLTMDMFFEMFPNEDNTNFAGMNILDYNGMVDSDFVGASCPRATKDLEYNTRMRNKAIEADYVQYGPLNLADEEYWVRIAEHWNTSPEVAKESRCSNCTAFDISPRMLQCIKAGPTSENIEDAEGYLGYCWMHSFKCHSARACYTWAAGGPISEDDVSYEWAEKSE